MQSDPAHLEPAEISRLLETAATNPGAVERLVPAVYAQLRALAASYLGADRAPNTLQPTALVHEAFVRLLGAQELAFESRAHFFAIAANAMRFVLADHARQKRAQKRGGGWARITLSGIGSSDGDADFDAADVDEALEELARLNERQARVVEMRFFGGLTVEQIAAVLGVSKRTIDAEWHFARAWLRGRLEDSR
ncbi:MAG: sigma-70 family RNA polymerase sigma factor [Phycisphaeraceae bacterium]|nr:MAG: sigma-70 family RNA polymerase sigma factor [Phycisphaeraceae bacterium]